MRFVASILAASVMLIDRIQSSDVPVPRNLNARMADLKGRVTRIKVTQQSTSAEEIEQDVSEITNDSDREWNGGIANTRDENDNSRSSSMERKYRTVGSKILIGQSLISGLMEGYAERQKELMGVKSRQLAKRFEAVDMTEHNQLKTEEFFRELEMMLKETNNIKRKSRISNLVRVIKDKDIIGDSIADGEAFVQRLIRSRQEDFSEEIDSMTSTTTEDPKPVSRPPVVLGGLLGAINAGINLKRAEGTKTLDEIDEAARRKLLNDTNDPVQTTTEDVIPSPVAPPLGGLLGAINRGVNLKRRDKNAR
jgi:hypothetical protein